jgi:hypothetical protein
LQFHNEEKRNYIQAPPNKTIQDVPDAHRQQFQFHSSIYAHLNNKQRQQQQQQLSLSLQHKNNNNHNNNNINNNNNNSSNEKGKSEKFSMMFKMFKRESGTSQQEKTKVVVEGTGTSENSKFHSNIVSMPRSNNLSTETSNNENYDLSGSTNLNQHSKFSSINNTSNNNNKTLSRSPSTISTATRKSFSSSASSNPSSDNELKNCL